MAAPVAALGSLIATAGSPWNFVDAARGAGADLAYTFAVAGAAALVAAPLAFAAARSLETMPAWMAVALPVVLPAPVAGVGLVAIANHPWADPFAGVMPVAAALARFLPVAAIVMAAFLRRIDGELWDAARIFQTGWTRGAVKVGVPLVRPGLVAASAAVFAFSLGELGATLVVIPPGFSTLSVRNYNYLHYGASETVAALCLISAAATLSAGWAVSRVRSS
jgi:iron(III) transport system permease protein